MKLKFNIMAKKQPDPFIFEDNGLFYIYTTGSNGVEAYCSDSVFGEWEYEGTVTDFSEGRDFWAPSVIKYQGMYYMYVSCEKPGAFQHMHVARASSPLGPFKDEKCLYDHFSIDSHVVNTKSGLFLLYAKNSTAGERIGTRVFIDRLIDPYTPANAPVEKIVPTFDEEIFTPTYSPTNKWHTIEGPFWFKEGEWQYIMYSGGCFQDDTYHIGYSAAKTDEEDLLKVDFVKHTNGDSFSPVLIKNEFEEGTGHHSVIKLLDEYYAIYHARDYTKDKSSEYIEQRTARICKLEIKDGIIKAKLL